MLPQVMTLIKAGSSREEDLPSGVPVLKVAEFFYDTIQGEGINIGQPAAFLRLQGCTLKCMWCDSVTVWPKGNPYTIPELIIMIEQVGLDDRLLNGQHLVITGGSPLLQQHSVIAFLKAFHDHFGFQPYVEIENETVRMPLPELEMYVSCWNNSPKLISSLNPYTKRYYPKIIEHMASLPNSWFKFVVDASDPQLAWDEIYEDYIEPRLIRKDQVILMPEGASREELENNRGVVINLAIKYGVRYSSREHVAIWDRTIGV